MSEKDVSEAAQVPLGDPVSTVKLEDARRRIVDWYKELGYYYVDVKYTLEPSADNTRARVRFDVTEGDQVIVRSIVIRGLDTTRESVVRRRVALEVGQPFRASDVRHTQERIATLGVFSSIQVGLSEPYVPQASKDVIVELVERPGHYIELSPGFSTGEGVRGTLEYDERNIFGYAIGATFRAQLSYLPDFLILDPQVEQNYQQVQDRLARRITLSGVFPDVGLGPLVRAQADAIYVRDLERDFALDKVSGSGTLIYRPGREFQVSLGQSVEDNDVHLFQFNSVSNYLTCSAQGDTALASLLRVPDGESFVVAQRLSVAWDRRDNAFNAHRGTYVYLGGELVNSTPEGAPIKPEHERLHVPDSGQRRASSPDERLPGSSPRAPGRGPLRAPDADLRRLHPDLQERLVRRRAAPRREPQDGVVRVHDPHRPQEPSAALLHVPRSPVLHGRLRLDARLAPGHVHAAGARESDRGQPACSARARAPTASSPSAGGT